MTDSQLIKGGTSGISTECLPHTTTDGHLMEVVDEPGKYLKIIILDECNLDKKIIHTYSNFIIFPCEFNQSNATSIQRIFVAWIEKMGTIR